MSEVTTNIASVFAMGIRLVTLNASAGGGGASYAAHLFPAAPVFVFESSTTARDVFEFLSENRDKTVIIDANVRLDAARARASAFGWVEYHRVLGILKAAGEGSAVMWAELGVSDAFIFKGRILLVTNVELDPSIVSRSINFKI